MQAITEKSRVLADRFIDYVTKGISPYHAVSETARLLREKGKTLLNKALLSYSRPIPGKERLNLRESTLSQEEVAL